MPKRKRAAAKSETRTETAVEIKRQLPEGGVQAQYTDHVTFLTRDVDVRIAFWQLSLEPGAQSVPACYLGSYVLTRQGAEAFLEAFAGALGRCLEPPNGGSS
jgi:hypothetical protein